MLKCFVRLSLLALAALSISFVGGCETEAQSDALIGGAIGAGVGALAGGDTEGTLIGAAVGTGAGYIVGNEADKKKMTIIIVIHIFIITPSFGFQIPPSLVFIINTFIYILLNISYYFNSFFYEM